MNFSDFTSICDRNFVMAYLTPAFIFVSLIVFSFVSFPQSVASESASSDNLNNSTFGFETLIESLNNFDSIFGTFILNFFKDIGEFIETIKNLWVENFLVLTFSMGIISILLFILNFQLISVLEGYYILEKIPYLKKRELKKFDKLNQKIEESWQKYDSNTRDSEAMNKYIDLMVKLRTEFPSDSAYVLPTPLGNVIRSFETYPLKAYGLDAIAIWPRIIHFATDEHRKAINDSKANVDFAVNLFYSMIIVIAEYTLLSFATSSLPIIGFPFMLLISCWLSYLLAIQSAKEWGVNVKSVFDLYRCDMLSKVGVDTKSDFDEKNEWEKLSRLFSYWQKV